MADKLNPRQRLAHKLRDGRYRAKQMGCPHELVTIAQAEAAGLLAEDKCYYCGCLLQLNESVSYSLEHKEPLKLGGAHELSNLAKSCSRCNGEKHMHTELEYLAMLDGRLYGGKSA